MAAVPGLTFNAQTLINTALQLIGVTAAGVDAAPKDSATALLLVNSMIDGWALKRLTIPSLERNVLTFTQSVSTYSVGPGATWNITRPIQNQLYMAVLAATAAVPFEIPMTELDDQSYQLLSIKGQTATYPFNWYYNALNGPAGSIFVWPTPTDAANYQAVLYQRSILGPFADYQTSTTLAPGYFRMLLYNFAREAELAWNRPPDPRIQLFAQDSMDDVERGNVQKIDLQPGAAFPGTDGIYNIYGDLNY